MARFHYDLEGCEPIIRDVQMFDAASISSGEFIMQAATAATKCSFITGVTGSNAEMVNGLGIAMETITTAGTISGITQGVASTGNYLRPSKPFDTGVSIATTVAAGARYGKALINPMAVYTVEYSQLTGDTPQATTNEAADTTITMTAIEQGIDGGWIYSTSLSPVVAEQGQLRYVSAANVNTLTYLTAATYTGGSTKIVKILPVNHELTTLTADAQKLASQLAAGSGISLKIVQNFITPDGRGPAAMEVLRPKLHDTSKQLSDVVKFYADVRLINHCYGRNIS
jgi:hypothetical protein